VSYNSEIPSEIWLWSKAFVVSYCAMFVIGVAVVGLYKALELSLISAAVALLAIATCALTVTIVVIAKDCRK
jgi:hypothetical protein